MVLPRVYSDRQGEGERSIRLRACVWARVCVGVRLCGRACVGVRVCGRACVAEVVSQTITEGVTVLILFTTPLWAAYIHD